MKLEAIRSVVACSFIWQGIALAQSASAQDSATLQSLVTEVRQLRLAVERAASVVPQTQILLQRVQLQQQRVDSLARQLEQLRDQMAHSEAEDSALAARMKNAEARIGDEQDPSRRREMEETITAVKTQLERSATTDAQERGRESELAAQLQTE